MPRLLGREIDVVVFDKDGVLLDFRARWEAIARQRAAALVSRLEAACGQGAVDEGSLTAGAKPANGSRTPLTNRGRGLVGPARRDRGD